MGEEGLAQPHEAVTEAGCLPPGQCHFGPHGAGHVARRDPLAWLPERVHGTGLRRRRGTLDPFQLGDEVDAVPVAQGTHVDRTEPSAKRGDRRRHGIRKALCNTTVGLPTGSIEPHLIPHEETL